MPISRKIVCTVVLGMVVNIVATQPRLGMITKRKCGAVRFIRIEVLEYLCWNKLTQDPTPVQYGDYDLAYQYKWWVPSFTLSKLNFPDSYSRLNRNTFTNIRRLRDKTKVKNISQLTTPIGALLCKFRQTCFRVLSTQGCRYNKKKPESLDKVPAPFIKWLVYLNVTPYFWQI